MRKIAESELQISHHPRRLAGGYLPGSSRLWLMKPNRRRGSFAFGLTRLGIAFIVLGLI